MMEEGIITEKHPGARRALQVFRQGRMVSHIVALDTWSRLAIHSTKDTLVISDLFLDRFALASDLKLGRSPGAADILVNFAMNISGVAVQCHFPSKYLITRETPPFRGIWVGEGIVLRCFSAISAVNPTKETDITVFLGLNLGKLDLDLGNLHDFEGGTQYFFTNSMGRLNFSGKCSSHFVPFQFEDPRRQPDFRFLRSNEDQLLGF